MVSFFCLLRTTRIFFNKNSIIRIILVKSNSCSYNIILNQYKPIIITFSVIALIIIATVQYVQSLINQPIDLSIQNNKLELLDSELLDNVIIPKQFEFKGTKIALAWTDDNTGEDLIIQSDKKIYYGFNNIEVYFSITNTNKQDQDMDIVVWVGDGRIRVEEMERLDLNTAAYAPLASVASAHSESGRDAQQRRERGFETKDIKGFEIGYVVNDEIESGQTNYYKTTIKYPPMSKGEFFIEAFGKEAKPLRRGFASSAFAYGHLDPWYNSNWSYWKKITINSNQIATTTSSFPVLATSTDSDLRTITHGGHVGQDNGYDIVFADSDGETLLNYEREKYASTTGEIVYWIKTDISSTTDKVIYMYYGNSGASDLATTTGVWDDEFVGVWHLAHDGVATTSYPDFLDSTQYDNDGSSANMNSADLVDGQANGALDFDGGNDRINCGNVNEPVATGKITISAWASQNSVNVLGVIISDWNISNKRAFFLKIENQQIAIGISNTGSNYRQMNSANQGMSTGIWYHMAATWDGTTGTSGYTIYLNGVDVGSLTEEWISGDPDGIYDSGEPMYIGDCPSWGGEEFDGLIDEVRVSNTVRSAGWIETEYNNQSDVENFLSFGAEVCVPKPVERSGGENIKTRIKGGVKF